jgi:hypothetical protein
VAAQPEVAHRNEPSASITAEFAFQQALTSPQATLPVGRTLPRRERRDAPAQQHRSPIVYEPVVTPVTEPVPGDPRSTPQADAQALLSLPSLADKPEPAPTIRITIGRVVVRAAPSDERASAPRPSLPQPPLSLSEYLIGIKGDAQ